MKFRRGQQLRKIRDGSIVKISQVDSDCIVLDGDFEPNHVVMIDKVLSYYALVEEQTP